MRCYFKIWVDGKGGGLVDLLGFGWRDRGWVPCIFPIFYSIFLLLLIVLSWLVHDGCCFCFSAELELVLILLKMELRNLVGLHSSLRWFDRVYQGRFVLDSAEELSQKQVWRQSLKAHQCFGSFDSSLTTVFQVYLSKCWVLVCKSRLYDTTFFLLFSCFFAKLIFSLPPVWVSSLPLIALGFVYIGQGKALWFVEGSIFFQDFVSSWMFVWEGGINGCGWWLKGLCQIQCVSWIFHHSDCLICDKDIIINVLLQ